MAFPIVPVAVGLGTQILGGLIGGKRKTEAAVPQDLAPMRAQNIGMLNFLLGMGRDPRQDMFTSWEDRIPGYSKYKKETRAKLREAWERQEARKIIGQPFGGIPAPTTKDALFAPATGMGTPMAAPAAAPPTPQFLPGGPGGPLVQMMADGGMVRGPGGPKDDMVPALLSNGEGVLNTDAVEALGGPKVVQALNLIGMLKERLGDDENGEDEEYGKVGKGDLANVLAMLQRHGGRVQRMQDGGIAGLTMDRKPQPTLGPLPGAGALPGGPVGTTTMPQVPQRQGGGAPGADTLPVSIDKQQPQGGGVGGAAGGMMGGTQGGQSAQGNLGSPVSGLMDARAMNPAAYAELDRLDAMRSANNGQLDWNAINANPQGFQNFLQQAAQAGYNYSPTGQLMGGPQGGPQVQPNINVAGGGAGGAGVPQGGGVMSPQQRLESMFGSLGIRPSNLQQAATAGFMGQLTNVSPEQRAAEITLPQLQQTLGGSPFTQDAINRMMGLQAGAGADVEGRLGQLGTRPALGSQQMQDVLSQLATGGGMSNLGTGPLQQLLGAQGSGAGMGELGALAGQNAGERVMAALDPVFQRNLAAANQQGGRFGSANAILRARAAEDFNRQAAEAMLTGAGQQIQAASALGNVGAAQDQLRLQTRLGAAQSLGELGRQQDALRLEALGLTQRGEQGLTDAQLRAMQLLGGFRQQEAQTMGDILGRAGTLGVQQGQLGTEAARSIADILGQQGRTDLARLQSAFGAGTTLTDQENFANRQVNQILQQLFGASLGATMNVPATQTPSAGEQIAQAGMGLANLVAMGGGGR